MSAETEEERKYEYNDDRVKLITSLGEEETIEFFSDLKNIARYRRELEHNSTETIERIFEQELAGLDDEAKATKINYLEYINNLIIERIIRTGQARDVLENPDILSKLHINYSSDRAKLITSLGEKGIREYLDDPTRLVKLGMADTYWKVELITSLGEEGIRSYLDNPEALDNLRISGVGRAKLITSLGEEGIRSYLDNPEALDNLRIDSDVRAKLIISLGEEGIIEYLDNPDKLTELGIVGTDCKVKLEADKKVNLPDDMTIGVEIESINQCDIDSLKKVMEVTANRAWIGEGWGDKGDPSLHDEGHLGREIVSPVLSGKRAKEIGRPIENEIESVCSILSISGHYTNDTCGGHVHIGADYLKSAQAFRNLLELWGNTENIMYIIANEEGDVAREGVAAFAAPISGNLEKEIEKGTINLEDEQDLKKFKGELVEFQIGTPNKRDKGINFISLQRHGTIEFRLPNGTINPNTWIENINLFGGVIRASQDLAEIQELEESERMPEQQEYLESFEGLKSEGLDEDKKLALLLKLIIPEEKERAVYERRYKVNKEILETQHPERKFAIMEKTAKKGIRIKHKEIGKGVLAGEDRITGEEMRAVFAALRRDLNSELGQRYSTEKE